MASKPSSQAGNAAGAASAALSSLSKTCMQEHCHTGQEAHLMANSLDESGLAAARRASAEVEEPRGWALQQRLQLTNLFRPVNIGKWLLQWCSWYKWGVKGQKKIHETTLYVSALWYSGLSDEHHSGQYKAHATASALSAWQTRGVLAGAQQHIPCAGSPAWRL